MSFDLADFDADLSVPIVPSAILGWGSGICDLGMIEEGIVGRVNSCTTLNASRT